MTEGGHMIEWYCQCCKGYLETWVARPNQPLQTVAAAIATISTRHGIVSGELWTMVRDVRRESIQPFFGSPFYSGLERQRRLQELVDALKARRTL